MLKTCTLTGVDEKTSFDWIVSTAAAYPFAEFGVLFSMTPEDKDDRYPPREFVDRFADAMAGTKVRTALHICGRAVNSFVDGDAEARALAARFGRVQINFNLARAPFAVADLDEAISSVVHPVITQHFPSNADVSRLVTAPNHHVLFDASGGNGRRGDGWPERVAGKYMGYAGGFGPETIEIDVMEAELHSAGRDYWIDMESRIRTDGLLDLRKCETVLSLVEPWTRAPVPREVSILQHDGDGAINGALSFGA